MAEVHHFAYGWISPTLAYLMSFLGSLLGLVFTARSRESAGASRARWLLLAAIAIGSTGIWLMHFMAMLGFDVPESAVRYDIGLTVVSLMIAVAIVWLGLLAVGFGQPHLAKIILGGTFTGVGVAAMHYIGMAAMRVNGRISYDPPRVGLSVIIAVITAIVALWFAVVIRGPSATIGAALIMAVAVSSMHYTAMSAVRVHLAESTHSIHGTSPIMLLVPIFIMAGVLISTLAYSTVGISIHRDTAKAEARLARRHQVYTAARRIRVGAGR